MRIILSLKLFHIYFFTKVRVKKLFKDIFGITYCRFRQSLHSRDRAETLS